MNGFNPPPDYWDDPQNKAAMVRLTITDDEKRACIAVAREYVQERYRDVGMLYKADSRGDITHVAVGLARPIIDNMGHLSALQRAPVLFSEWYPYSDDLDRQLTILWEAWIDAWGYCQFVAVRRRETLPDFDWQIQHQLKLHRNKTKGATKS